MLVQVCIVDYANEGVMCLISSDYSIFLFSFCRGRKYYDSFSHIPTQKDNIRFFGFTYCRLVIYLCLLLLLLFLQYWLLAHCVFLLYFLVLFCFHFSFVLTVGLLFVINNRFCPHQTLRGVNKKSTCVAHLWPNFLTRNAPNIGAHIIVGFVSLAMRCWDLKLLIDLPGMVLDLLLSKNGLVMFAVVLVVGDSKSGFSSWCLKENLQLVGSVS